MSTSPVTPASSSSPAPASTSTSSTSSTPAAQTHLQKIGQISELAGIGAFVGGLILSAHHYAIAACFVAGAAAYVIGKQLRKA